MIDVGRVARAIFYESASDLQYPPEWETVSLVHEAYQCMARAAALEVLRQLEEPSVEMYVAGDERIIAFLHEERGIITQPETTPAIQCWQAMLRIARASLESPPLEDDTICR